MNLIDAPLSIYDGVYHQNTLPYTMTEWTLGFDVRVEEEIKKLSYSKGTGTGIMFYNCNIKYFGGGEND